MRRLRVGLELWGQLLREKDRVPVAALARRTKRLARLVGQVRDRDIVLELLERTRPSDPDPAEARSFQQFWGRLKDEARTSRELLRAFLTTERDAGLLRSIAESLKVTPRAHAAADLARLMAEENRARHDKVRRAHRRASERPSSERLHRLRIRLRQLRHVSELTRSVVPAAAHPIPTSFRKLQDRLGELHDLDVALATLEPSLDRSAWAADLRKVRRRVRVSARRELDRLTAGSRPGTSSPRGPGRRPPWP